VRVSAIAERADATLLDRLVAQADVVLDCCDNFATRQAVNRACVQHGKPLVSGAAIRMDGQVSVFDPRQADSPCYACVFPPEPAPEETLCATMGVFAPLVGIIGTVQAAEALKLLSQTGSAWQEGCSCWTRGTWTGARCASRGMRIARFAAACGPEGCCIQGVWQLP